MEANRFVLAAVKIDALLNVAAGLIRRLFVQLCDLTDPKSEKDKENEERAEAQV